MFQTMIQLIPIFQRKSSFQKSTGISIVTIRREKALELYKDDAEQAKTIGHIAIFVAVLLPQ